MFPAVRNEPDHAPVVVGQNDFVPRADDRHSSGGGHQIAHRFLHGGSPLGHFLEIRSVAIAAPTTAGASPATAESTATTTEPAARSAEPPTESTPAAAPTALPLTSDVIRRRPRIVAQLGVEYPHASERQPVFVPLPRTGRQSNGEDDGECNGDTIRELRQRHVDLSLRRRQYILDRRRAPNIPRRATYDRRRPPEGSSRMHSRISVAAVLVAFASGTAIGSQVLVRQQAPTDRAASVSLAALELIVTDMDAEQRTTVRLLEGGSYNTNIRRIRSGETALMHPRTTDVYVVREGSGTLVIGGRIVDENGRPIDGQRGAGIDGGTEQRISAGDLALIPAGVTHGFRETNGITWFNIRFDPMP